MRDKLRWLAVPPALALLLMFGPWRNNTASRNPSAGTQTSGGVEAATVESSAGDSAKPGTVALPDLTQVVCTVLGVCLLGAAIVMGLARVRASATGSGTALAVRQSLRLSGRHTVHAVEFADKLLLLGECEGSLRVLHSGDDPQLAPAASRTALPPEPDDDGVVLKDMIIPRPPRGDTSAVPRSASQPPSRGLRDFRALLGKTQVHA